MAIIKKDSLNSRKMEEVSASEALEESMRVASMLYDTQQERVNDEHKKLTEIVGRLLDTLHSKKVLDDREIVKILETYTIVCGEYVGETPQG